MDSQEILTKEGVGNQILFLIVIHFNLEQVFAVKACTKYIIFGCLQKETLFCTDELQLQMTSHPCSSSNGLNDSSQLQAAAAAVVALHLQDEISTWQPSNHQTLSVFDICNGSPSGRWSKIRAATIWLSLWKHVAAKRNPLLHPYFHFSA